MFRKTGEAVQDPVSKVSSSDKEQSLPKVVYHIACRLTEQVLVEHQTSE